MDVGKSFLSGLEEAMSKRTGFKINMDYEKIIGILNSMFDYKKPVLVLKSKCRKYRWR